jgi:hypothetical protein
VLGEGSGSVTSIRHPSGGHLIALVGAVVDSSGEIVRLIFHDPYGDQTRNPSVAGYYSPDKDYTKYDQDPPAMAGAPNACRTWGRYAPYGTEINSADGQMTGKWWLIFKPAEPMTAETMKKRMLPSEPPPPPSSSASSGESSPSTQPAS